MTRRLMVASAATLVTLCGATVEQARRPVLASPHVDAPRPPQRLADTGLYDPTHPGVVDPRNRHFSPQYPLWSDGLSKKRWMYLPPGETIDATQENAWRYPVGTRFWKEFSLDGRKIETRLSWRASEAGWVFASYAWNDGGTDAVLVPDDGLPAVTDIAPGRRHSIPSRTDCTACHGSDGNPLGFNALQLSTDRDPNAVHGEPLPPGAVTLKELVEDRLFSPVRTDLVASPPRIRTANPETRAVLGYLAANCAMCHNGSGTIAAPGPVIRYDDLLRDGDAVARTLLRQPTRWQVPGAAEGDSMLVNPGSPDSSAILVRMRSRAPSSQMPPLGTVVRDQEAVEAIARWIKGDLARLHPSHSW